MTNLTAEIYETCQKLTPAIHNESNLSIEFISNGHGSVTVNTDTKDFTYTGKFGNDVLGLILKTKCINNLPQKIACLASIMVAYRDTGGFVFLETLK